MDHTQQDEIAFAAYSYWRNGSSVYEALVHVSRNHSNGAVREQAGQAADEALRVPVIWRGFEVDFEKRDEVERRAQGA